MAYRLFANHLLSPETEQKENQLQAKQPARTRPCFTRQKHPKCNGNRHRPSAPSTAVALLGKNERNWNTSLTELVSVQMNQQGTQYWDISNLDKRDLSKRVCGFYTPYPMQKQRFHKLISKLWMMQLIQSLLATNGSYLSAQAQSPPNSKHWYISELPRRDLSKHQAIKWLKGWNYSGKATCPHDSIRICEWRNLSKIHSANWHFKTLDTNSKIESKQKNSNLSKVLTNISRSICKASTTSRFLRTY